jgi:hypothetical protein
VLLGASGLLLATCDGKRNVKVYIVSSDWGYPQQQKREQLPKDFHPQAKLRVRNLCAFQLHSVGGIHARSMLCGLHVFGSVRGSSNTSFTADAMVLAVTTSPGNAGMESTSTVLRYDLLNTKEEVHPEFLSSRDSSAHGAAVSAMLMLDSKPSLISFCRSPWRLCRKVKLN